MMKHDSAILTSMSKEDDKPITFTFFTSEANSYTNRVSFSLLLTTSDQFD